MGWLENQVALVTGGTGGIGRAIVRRFIDEGAKVAVLGRNTDQLGELSEEFGDRVVTIAGDVTSMLDNQRAVEATVEAFGKLDTFVANAAVFDYFTPLAKIGVDELEEQYLKLFSVNVYGYMAGARCAAEELKKTNGSMIFTLSNSSFYAGGGGVLYVTSKHALVGLIRQLAYEYAPDIRVNGVAPGATNTAMKSLDGISKRSAPLNDIPGFEEKAAQAVPLKKIAQPEDHTGHYVLLASRENSGLTTAHIIHSDGGWEVRAPGG